LRKLDNSVAVITGATSGMGKAIAETFYRKQIRMVLHGRNENKLKQIANATQSKYVLGDITRPDIPGKLLQTAREHFNHCDIVVNNAGVLEVGAIEDINIDKVCEMVRVNIEASYRVVYTFVKYFKENDAGHIINISSTLGTKVREKVGAYAGTKFAIEALSEALRIELAKTNVKITCIEPGLVKTDFHRNWKIDPTKLMDVPNPLTPEDIADAVLYVLQQKANIRIPRLMIIPKDNVI
jgi:NADP-dependent 3-hydroxy acid dehydrogenase YdfG